MNLVDKILLHISLIPGIGPSVGAQLIEHLGEHNLPNIYYFTVHDIVERCGLSFKQATLLYEGLQDSKALDEECELLEQHQVSWISRCSDDYPKLLQEIHVPPIGIYVRGVLPKSAALSIGIVGARKSHTYAQRVINQCVPELVAHGCVIVSGGALGADTMAHEAALKASGITVSVLGSGLLRPYPAANKKLFDRIVSAGGAIVSPFSLRTDPLPGNFPARNRIIAGLSSGCVVIQAGEKSGAIITAYCALEQGREVFAVPGSIDDPLSAGCHGLIRQGAVLMRNAADILSEFGYASSAGGELSIGQMEIPSAVSVGNVEDSFLVHCQIPVSVDELLEKTGLTLSEVYSRLSDLQLQGRVEQNFIGLWQKT